VDLANTLSQNKWYRERPRLCQLGFLRASYKRTDGAVGYRCPGEPLNSYEKKGGTLEETAGKKCLCNALMANVGLAQEQLSGYIEKALLTGGDSLEHLKHFLQNGVTSYKAHDVIHYLLSSLETSAMPA